MKRADDVFFFVLIDFLIQVCFFGLLLYVAFQTNQTAKDVQHSKDNEQITTIKKVAGVSNLTELTDLLTRLAPITEQKGMADFISNEGGMKNVKDAIKTVDDAGGIEKVKESLVKLRKFEEGTGKPPCLYDVVAGKKVMKILAEVIATDNTISFKSSTPQLEETLSHLGRSYNEVHEMPLGEFRRAFSPLLQIQPECRYTLGYIETTRLVDARDAAGSAFYLAPRKQ